MAKTRVELNSPGVRALLSDDGVGDYLEELALGVAAAAEAGAPVDTGEYRGSIGVEVVHTDRIVARVVADSDHALLVEAHTGNLARALDASGFTVEDPDELIDYVTRSGKTRKATRRQVEHWTRGKS